MAPLPPGSALDFRQCLSELGAGVLSDRPAGDHQLAVCSFAAVFELRGGLYDMMYDVEVLCCQIGRQWTTISSLQQAVLESKQQLEALQPSPSLLGGLLGGAVRRDVRDV